MKLKNNYNVLDIINISAQNYIYFWGLNLIFILFYLVDTLH